MAPNINNPGGVKNDPDEIRDGVVSDATRFPGGFIDQQVTEAGADVAIGTEFAVSTGSLLDSFDLASEASSPKGLTLTNNGSRLSTVDTFSNEVVQFTLSTSFEVSTATVDTRFDISTQTNFGSGLAFSTPGSRLYIIESSNENVYEYDLSTDFDVSTATFTQTFDISSEDSRPEGIAFSESGDQLFTAGNSGSKIYQYDLTTAFDTSTASFDNSFSVSGQSNSPTDVAFTPDGSVMYVVGRADAIIYQYDLSTDFNVLTASFDQSFDVSSQETSPQGMAVRDSGRRLYVNGVNSEKAHQYALGKLVSAI